MDSRKPLRFGLEEKSMPKFYWAEVELTYVPTDRQNSYSTLPRNGRIHGLSEITGIYIGSRTDRFCLSRQDLKIEDRTGRVGRAEDDPQGTDLGCPKPSCIVSDFNRTDSPLRPSGVELETVCRKTLGHSICDIIGCGYFL